MHPELHFRGQTIIKRRISAVPSLVDRRLGESLLFVTSNFTIVHH